MSEFLTLLSSCVTASINWMGSVVDFIVDTPLILVPMLVFFVAGGSIGLINRLIRG